jgi:type IV secretion system protein VirB10
MADEENIPPPPPDPSPAVPPVEPEPVLESPSNEENDYVIEEEAPQELAMQRGPSIGGGKAKPLAMGLIMLIVMGVVLYSLFGGKPNKPTAQIKAIPVITPSTDIVAMPAPIQPTGVPSLNPTLPGIPSVPPVPPPPPPPSAPPLPPPPPKFTGSVIPPPPPPPPKPGAPPAAPDVKTLSPIAAATGGGGEKDASTKQRLRSNMLILDGGTDAKAEAERDTAQGSLDSHDANRAFESNVLKSTKAQKELATRLNNLNMTIAQGKIINAVLETAINTDLPGPLRAIVGRDVYAESGREIVIPKGSRLIGVYNSSVLHGQSRVLIVWTRVIRPDGVDIMVGSPGVDSLGRAGIYGITDNKYSEIFSAALLTSVISIGVAVGADHLVKDPSTTTTNNANGTTTTGSAGSAAATSAVNEIGGVTKDVVSSMLDLKPTITVDQGTLVNVFVNKDLTFPTSSSGAQFIE